MIFKRIVSPESNISPPLGDIILIVGYDNNHDYISNGIGNNMLEYLAHLIDIMRYQKHQDTKIVMEKLKNTQNICFIPTTVHTSDFLNFDPEIIKRGFEDGILSANQFVIDKLPIPINIQEYKKKTLKRKQKTAKSLMLTELLYCNLMPKQNLLTLINTDI